jgi:hypothetical protein
MIAISRAEALARQGTVYRLLSESHGNSWTWKRRAKPEPQRSEAGALSPAPSFAPLTSWDGARFKARFPPCSARGEGECRNTTAPAYKYCWCHAAATFGCVGFMRISNVANSRNQLFIGITACRIFGGTSVNLSKGFERVTATAPALKRGKTVAAQKLVPK